MRKIASRVSKSKNLLTRLSKCGTCKYEVCDVYYVEHCNGGKLVLLFIIISRHAVARICPEGVCHECLALAI